MYGAYYTSEQKDAYMKHLLKLQNYAESCEMDLLYDIFLGIYSNPVDSKNKYDKQSV